MLKLDQPSFKKIGDLVYYEGPYVSVMLHVPADTLFCFYWATKGTDYHRWMVFRIDENLLERLINKEISFLEFIQNPLDKHLVFIDSHVEDGVIHFRNHTLVAKKDLQVKKSRYLPQPDAMFEEEDAEDFDQIMEMLRKRNTQTKRAV